MNNLSIDYHQYCSSSETILGYCSITCAPDSTNIGCIICGKSSIKVWWRMWFNLKKSVDSSQKIKFSTTSMFRIECFKNLQEGINILMIMKFPLIISVMGTHACYHHVVVIWKEDDNWLWIQVYLSIDQWFFEANLWCQYYLCWNCCGYGIFPPNHICNSMDNISIEDWGINKYNIKASSIRKYFKW